MVASAKREVPCRDDRETQRKISLLAESTYFSDMPAEIINEIVTSASEKSFMAGETVYAMSQFDGGDVFCLTEGSAQLTTIRGEGNAILVETIASGAVVGLEFVLANAEQNIPQTELRAITNLSALMIDSEQIKGLIRKRPAFAQFLLPVFAKKLLQLTNNQVAVQPDAATRVFRTILKMMHRDVTNEVSVWKVPVLPRHKELAVMAGVEEADAAEAVAFLISEGAVKREYPGLRIIKRDALVEFSK